MSKTALFLNYQVIAWLVDGEIERLTSNKSGIQKFLKENEKKKTNSDEEKVNMQPSRTHYVDRVLLKYSSEKYLSVSTG